jgi:hypothetical protein
MLYLIFCVLQGETSIIGAIRIDETETVGELKMQIKNKNPNDLANIAADNLTLYSIDVVCPDQNERANLLIQKTQQLTSLQPLDPLCTLSEVWKDGTPKGGMIHIMVQLPSK